MGASKHILVYTCLFCRHKTINTSDVGLMTPKMGVCEYTGLFCCHKTSNTSDVGLMTPKTGVSEYCTGLFRYHITSETSGVGLIVMSMTGVREHMVSFAFTQRGTRYPRKMQCYVHE